MAEVTMERSNRSAGVRRLPLLVYQVHLEVVKLLRIPMFSVPTFLFPILFFTMFGLPNVDETLDGINAGRYTMASFGTYAVMATALFSFGVTIATERGLGWNKLLRTTPLEPLTYFASKVIMAVLFGTAVLAALFAFGAFVGGIEMSVGQWAELGGLLVLGMVPFVCLGLLLGYVAGPNSAAAVANLIFLPLAFGSGLFMPLEFLPEVMQDVAPYLPSYHVAQLGWQVLGTGDGAPFLEHVVWVAGYALIFLAAALIAYRHDEGKTFG